MATIHEQRSMQSLIEAGPTPGRPASLGEREDLADAQSVTEVVRAAYSTLERQRPRAGPLRLVREAVWYLWEQPRLPRPLIRDKYPLAYPWSPGAQEVIEHAASWNSYGRPPDGQWSLVIEHLYPRELMIRDLVELVVCTDQPARPVADLLSSRVMAAIVRRDEDRQLMARREAPRTWAPYEADPWLRYRSAPFELGGFASVAEKYQWQRFH
jgi:hypothetical protein